MPQAALRLLLIRSSVLALGVFTSFLQVACQRGRGQLRPLYEFSWPGKICYSYGAFQRLVYYCRC